MKIQIGNTTFGSKRQLEDEVRGMLRGLMFTESVKANDVEKFRFFLELFQRHPDWNTTKCPSGRSVLDIAVLPNAINKTSFTTYIILDNGETKDISYKFCISGKHRTIDADLTKAMRTAIQPQIDAYRQSRGIVPCDSCGAIGFTEVDHSPSFSSIRERWLKICPAIPSEFSEDKQHRTCFTVADESWSHQWQEFHHKESSFQMLCSSCNNRKGSS